MELKSHAASYNPETLNHLRKLIEERLVGIELLAQHNHRGEPQFLEELACWEKRTGERGEEWGKHLILNSQSEEDKKDLEYALERLDKGTYGFCEWPGCGGVIPFVRLEALPQAKHCLPCEVKIKANIPPRRINGRRI